MKKLLIGLTLLASMSTSAGVKCDKEAAEAARSKSQQEWDPSGSEAVGVASIKYLETVDMVGGSYKTFHVLIGDSAGSQLWHVMTLADSCRIVSNIEVRHD